MSKALPPWEVIPPWEKPAPVSVVQKVRFAHLENTFIPTMPPPPPPPKPVSVPPPQPPSNAHRRAISLPKNPRPIRPKPPSSPKPVDASAQSTNDTSQRATKDSSPISTSNPIPPPLPEVSTITRTRSRSSTLPGAIAFPPSSASAPATSRAPLPLDTSYSYPPSSTKSPISPQKQWEDKSLTSDTSLSPAPQPAVLPTSDTNNIPAIRTSKFNTLKILTQNSNTHTSPSSLSTTSRSPKAPTPDLPASWANTIGPIRSMTSRKKSSKHLASPSYNKEIFALIETKGSRVVAIGDNEKDTAEYVARTPRTPKASNLPSPRAEIKSSKSLNEHARHESRRLASPGYIKEKYSMVEMGGNGDVDKAGDVVVSGGRSPGIREEDMKTDTKPLENRGEDQNIYGELDSSTSDILDMYDQEMAPPSPKPTPPPKDPPAGPRLIPLKYASLPSPKKAAPVPTGPPVPKLIPLKFLSPPSPEESEDESFAYQYEPVEDLASDVTLKVAPLRIPSREISPTSLKSTKNTPTPTPTATTTQPPKNTTSTQPPSSLTAHLISCTAPKKLYNATHSSFLRSWSKGTISPALLSRYLTQERIFLQSYLRFLSLLLANISIAPRPAHLSPRSASPITAKSEKKDINARLTSHLLTQLSHTQKQLSLFSSLSNEYVDLELESWEPGTEDGMSDATRMLVRLFDVIGSAVERGEKSVLVGVVILWVREKAHHEAFKPLSTPSTSPNPLSRLHPIFSGPESQSSIDSLLKLLDDLFLAKYMHQSTTFEERGDRMSKNLSPMKNKGGSWEADVKEMEEMMDMVLDIMARGWPAANAK